MTRPSWLIPERRIPLLRRPALQLAAVMALLGVALAAYLWFGALHLQDRRPAQAIAAPGIGTSFVANDVFGTPVARITITSGQRHNERGAGGDRADRDFVTLFVTYEGIGSFEPDSQAWHVHWTGADLGSGNASLSLFPAGNLGAGTSAKGSVSFYSIVAGAAATITYQGAFDHQPLFTIGVAPNGSVP